MKANPDFHAVSPRIGDHAKQMELGVLSQLIDESDRYLDRSLGFDLQLYGAFVHFVACGCVGGRQVILS